MVWKQNLLWSYWKTLYLHLIHFLHSSINPFSKLLVLCRITGSPAIWIIKHLIFLTVKHDICAYNVLKKSDTSVGLHIFGKCHATDLVAPALPLTAMTSTQFSAGYFTSVRYFNYFAGNHSNGSLSSCGGVFIGDTGECLNQSLEVGLISKVPRWLKPSTKSAFRSSSPAPVAGLCHWLPNVLLNCNDFGSMI